MHRQETIDTPVPLPDRVFSTVLLTFVLHIVQVSTQTQYSNVMRLCWHLHHVLYSGQEVEQHFATQIISLHTKQPTATITHGNCSVSRWISIAGRFNETSYRSWLTQDIVNSCRQSPRNASDKSEVLVFLPFRVTFQLRRLAVLGAHKVRPEFHVGVSATFNLKHWVVMVEWCCDDLQNAGESRYHLDPSNIKGLRDK